MRRAAPGEVRVDGVLEYKSGEEIDRPGELQQETPAKNEQAREEEFVITAGAIKLKFDK